IFEEAALVHQGLIVPDLMLCERLFVTLEPLMSNGCSSPTQMPDTPVSHADQMLRREPSNLHVVCRDGRTAQVFQLPVDQDQLQPVSEHLAVLSRPVRRKSRRDDQAVRP